MGTGTISVGYSYVRFSSPRQAEGDSLARQVERAEQWCVRNGVKLDTSLTLHDLGKSAYTGGHRRNPDRNALALFLKMVEQGRIPRGSHLVLESLDRLSREDIRPALTLLLNLIEAGIRVVQLTPVEAVYGEDVEPMSLMMAIVELNRANSESKVKSDRCSAAWARKKTAARDSRKVMSANLPRWLELKDGEVRPIPERVAVVRRIFALATEGHGLRAIAQKLKAEGVPSFGGRREEWTRSYLNLILSDRRALGEHRFGVRNTDGIYTKDKTDVVAGYLPAVVTETEWAAVVRGMKERAGRPERRRGRHVNIFAGVLHCPEDGGAYHLTSWKYGSEKIRALINFRCSEGFSQHKSFRYDYLEAAVLKELRELKASDVTGRRGPSRAALLAAEVTKLESEVAALERDLEKDGESPAVARVLRKKEQRLIEARGERAAALADESHPAAESLGEVQTLADVLATADDPDDVRVKIRAALRRLVKRAGMYVIRSGIDRVAVVQFDFTDDTRRLWVILQKQALRPGGRLIREGGWVAMSGLLESSAFGRLDIWNADDREVFDLAYERRPDPGAKPKRGKKVVKTVPRWQAELAEACRQLQETVAPQKKEPRPASRE